MKRQRPSVLRETTTNLVLLANRYDNKLPLNKFKDFGDDKNAKRRKYDAINVLEAVDLVERVGDYIFFDPSLMKGIPKYQEMNRFHDLLECDPEITLPTLSNYRDDDFDPYWNFNPTDFVRDYYNINKWFY